MINIRISKLDVTGIHCANKTCKHLPTSTINILGSVYYIKVDTAVAIITLGNQSEYYCFDCIDVVYDLIKLKLDKSLWAYH